jgi:hypothetical protein
MELYQYEEDLDELFSFYKNKVFRLIDEFDNNNKQVIYYIGLLDKKTAKEFYDKNIYIVDKLNELDPIFNYLKIHGSLREQFGEIKTKYESIFYEHCFLYRILQNTNI